MQSIPDARQQSFEELYGPPENFLEIEVRLLAASTRPVPRTQLQLTDALHRSAIP
jgi:hypothetical protein